MGNVKEIDVNGSFIGKSILLVIIGIVILICLFGSWYTIPAGERGVLLTFSKPSMNSMGEGLHFKIPLIQSIVKMDVKTQKYEADLSAASKDLQTVSTKIAINYHVSPDKAPEIYQTIGSAYRESVIYPLEQETNKAVTAQFTAEELITKREEVRELMKTNLRDKLLPRGIIVEEISIVNFDFSPSFNAAIEAKVTAEQNALKELNQLKAVEYQAQQRVTQAKGEAEAIKIQAEAITIQGGDAYVNLQWINKWNGVMPLATGGSMPIINLGNLGAAAAATSA